jgi:hypothetical protein
VTENRLPSLRRNVVPRNKLSYNNEVSNVQLEVARDIFQDCLRLKRPSQEFLTTDQEVLV